MFFSAKPAKIVAEIVYRSGWVIKGKKQPKRLKSLVNGDKYLTMQAKNKAQKDN